LKGKVLKASPLIPILIILDNTGEIDVKAWGFTNFKARTSIKQQVKAGNVYLKAIT
jgi:hypothetical protein